METKFWNATMRWKNTMLEKSERDMAVRVALANIQGGFTPKRKCCDYEEAPVNKGSPEQKQKGKPLFNFCLNFWKNKESEKENHQKLSKAKTGKPDTDQIMRDQSQTDWDVLTWNSYSHIMFCPCSSVVDLFCY